MQIGRAGNLTSEIVPHDPFSRRASICNDGTGLVMVFGTVSGGGVSGGVGLYMAGLLSPVCTSGL